MLSAEDVKTEIELAFPPYRCVAKFEDIGHKISFKVYRDEDDNEGIKIGPQVVSPLLSGQLDNYIKDWRDQLRQRGYDLAAD